MIAKKIRILLVDEDLVRADVLRGALTAASRGEVEVVHVMGADEAEELEGDAFDATLVPTAPGLEPFPLNKDPLTGLVTRPGFEARLRHRIGRDRHFSVLFLDLDGFKDVNDSYGHQTGDRLLQEVARRLKQSVRAHDLCCRWGGDEFTVMLEGDQRRQELVCTAQRILHSLSHPTTIDGVVLRISASLGVASYPTDGQDMASLLCCADRAMYRAKFHGGARLRFFDRQLELFEPQSAVPSATTLP